MARTLAEVEAEIGIVVNPEDGRSWYRLLGRDFGDWDTTCGHYRRTNMDGTLVLIRDDTMAECTAYPYGPGGKGKTLASGWRWLVESDEDEDATPSESSGQGEKTE